MDVSKKRRESDLNRTTVLTPLNKQTVGKKRSKHILQIRMIEEFEAQLQQFARDMKVKDPIDYNLNKEGCRPTNDEKNPNEYENPKGAIYNEFTVSAFEKFLRKIEIINIKEKHDVQQHLKLLMALTPIEKKDPILSVRNIRALFYAVFNYYEDWMGEQDPQEFTEKDLTYNRKIWKYKIMIDKLKYEPGHALIESSKSNFDLLENVPT